MFLVVVVVDDDDDEINPQIFFLFDFFLEKKMFIYFCYKLFI